MRVRAHSSLCASVPKHPKSMSACAFQQLCKLSCLHELQHLVRGTMDAQRIKPHICLCVAITAFTHKAERLLQIPCMQVRRHLLSLARCSPALLKHLLHL